MKRKMLMLTGAWTVLTATGVGLTEIACGQGTLDRSDIRLPATPLHAKASVHWQGIALSDALKDLGTKTGVVFEYADPLPNGLDPVSLAMEKTEAGRVAMRILRPRGLTMENADRRRVTVVKADPYDELRAKREEIFAFVRKPVVTRAGDNVTVVFETKGWCDVTIAVEDARGRIVRHLASGVLGPNAPEPFEWNSKAQTVVWDGKDDAGVYVDDMESVQVRVSLGLKPRLERTLYWSPHKRYGPMPIIVPAPQGVFVFDGRGVDFLRLFDREGDYVRTVYPFPAERLADVQGLDEFNFPQGYRLPRKGGLYQHTLLSSGPNFNSGNHGVSRQANAASAMAVHGDRLALAYTHINRLGVDGSSGGLPLRGPKVGHAFKSVAGGRDDLVDVGPGSIAFSPDGRTLYLTGYMWRSGSWRLVSDSLHAVFKVAYESDDEPAVFLGDRDKSGSDNTRFAVPTSVATDAEGRVYVSDFLNDRVQIYDAAGRHVRTLATDKPARVSVDPNSGDIWVFSFQVVGVPHELQRQYNYNPGDILPQTLTKFSALPEARQTVREPFPLGITETIGFEVAGHFYQVVPDFHADEPTVWVVGRRHQARSDEFRFSGSYARSDSDGNLWKSGVRMHRRVDGAWKVVRAFGDDAVAAVVRSAPPRHNIQRLIVNPVSGRLYVAEADSGPTIKASNDWLEIDPRNGKIRLIRLPFNALEGAFDLHGHVYLRNTDHIVRYDFNTWREVPWDYGEANPRLGNDGSIYGRSTKVASALRMPATGPVCYHQGGIGVSPRGDIVASCAYRHTGISDGRMARDTKKIRRGDAYAPSMYPGRHVSSTSAIIHVWDRHGRLKYEDVLPGVGQPDGVAIDRAANIYVMHAPTRVYDGKRYFNEMSQTLMKVAPNTATVISSAGAPIPLADENRPARPPDLQSTRHGMAWAPGTEWFYGGVGFAGFNMIGHGGGCACWFSRFTLDLFARSIAPESHQYRVAVVDSAGNLILRIGQYGNVQDGVPLVADGGPANTRPIGGDEVSLIHACFVGTHTDRRIFIADMGNARIVSVNIGYHANEIVALKDVMDRNRRDVRAPLAEPRHETDNGVTL